MQNAPHWKTTFDERWPLMEENIQWNSTFDGRCPSMEGNLQWKMTLIDGKQSLIEDDLLFKTPFKVLQALVKMTFNGRLHQWRTVFDQTTETRIITIRAKKCRKLNLWTIIFLNLNLTLKGGGCCAVLIKENPKGGGECPHFWSNMTWFDPT